MGRNVLISGASHGIGAATAIAFAKDGCNVGINYHNNRAGAEETAAECRKYGVDAQIYCADIGCREQAVGMMRDFIEHFGTVDVLINNAGGALKMPKGEFCDMPLDYWDSQIALNLSGAAYLSHEAIKNMKEHDVEGFRRKIAAGYLATPEDIVPMIQFFADVEKTKYIVGQTIAVDGGQSIDGAIDCMLEDEF